MKYFKSLSLIFFSLIIMFCSSCATEKSNKIYDYKNIEIEKNYTDITQQDIENIIMLDYSSENYYQENSDKNVVDSDDTVLIDVKSNNEDLQTTNYYYNFGESEFSDEIDDYLSGKSVGQRVKCEVTYNGEKYNIEIYIKGIYKLPDIGNEKALLKFYNMNNKSEVLSYLEKRAKDEIIFNYMWEKILNNSDIYNFPQDIIERIKSNKNYTGALTDKENKEVYNFYFELTVAKIILDKEGITVTDIDIDNTKNKFIKKNNVSIEELDMYVTEDDVYYTAVMDKLKPILIAYAKIIN